MPIRNLTIAHINTQRVGVAFIVRGAFYFTAPKGIMNLQYQDDSGAMQPAHPAVTYNMTAFSFAHPGIMTRGQHRVTMRGEGSPSVVSSNRFEVV